MRWRWKAALYTLGIVVLAAAGWFGWGAWNAKRFDERLAAMYADGSLKTFAQLQGEPIPAGENGWALLKEADELREQVERRIGTELLDAGTSELEYTPDDRSEWTPDQVAHEKRVLRELGPMFAKLDEALARPRFVHRGTPPLDSTAFVPVLFACQRWLRRMRMDPARYPQDVDRMVGLLDRWEVRDGADADVRIVMWRTLAVTALREGVEAAHIDDAKREAWSDALRREEARALAGSALKDAWGRALLVWLLNGWRDGVDPLERYRAGLDWPVRRSWEAYDDTADCLGAFVRQVNSAARPPWYIAWYGRPWMQRHGNRTLDVVRAEPPRPFTLERVRGDLLGADEIAAHEARSILHTITALRLARVALAVRGAVDQGIGPAFELRVGVAARLGGRHLQDPLSEKLFMMEVRDKHVVVHPRPSSALNGLNPAYAKLEGEAREAQLHEDLLLWRIPAP